MRAFALKTTSIWLFHAPPPSTCEEPLNANSGRNDQTTLKELQRSAMYISAPTKKPLTLHAVELEPSIRLGYDASVCPLCVRFFDDAVVEIGSCIVNVPANSSAQDVISEAKEHIPSSWGMSGPLRLLEVVDSRLHRLYRADA